VARHQGVNFINIILKPFLCKSALQSFSLITVLLFNFWTKNIRAKAARKMLMKLTTGWELLGLIHSRHFCTQYFDKKIKRHFDKNIFFSSKYCNDISKYLESSQKNIFNTHRKKNIG